MILLPFHKYLINTDLDSMWVKKRISNNIREPIITPNPFDKRLFEKDFVGIFKGDCFKVSRVLEHGESLKAIIVGKIVEKEHGGTKITLIIRLPIIVYIVLFLLLVLAPIIFISVQISQGSISALFTINNIKLILYTTIKIFSRLEYLFFIVLTYLVMIIVPLNLGEKETIEIIKRLVN